MTEAPALPFVTRGGKRTAALRGARPSLPTPWTESAHPVEIVVNDPYCTNLLLEYATPLFPAEIVSDSPWVVRLQPPAGGGGWVLELLTLIHRWLESARLPCAKVLYGGRSYLIRTPIEAGSVSH
jgi:hypothetical protein